MKVRFIIPIRHPASVKNPEDQITFLREALASIAAQTAPAWTATIVANIGQRLPELPPGVTVRHVDFPPDTAVLSAQSRKEAYEAVRVDKGRRIAAGLADVEAGDLIMIVDDDDLIHRNLVAFATAQTRRCGWVIDHGYLWRTGSSFMTLMNRFHEKCGTSQLIPPEYFIQFTGSPDSPEAIRELGSHRLIFERLPYREPTWSRVPFAGAIYRLERSGFSRSQNLVASTSTGNVPRWRRTGLLRLVPPRPVTRRVRRDFFGAT